MIQQNNALSFFLLEKAMIFIDSFIFFLQARLYVSCQQENSQINKYE